MIQWGKRGENSSMGRKNSLLQKKTNGFSGRQTRYKKVCNNVHLCCYECSFLLLHDLETPLKRGFRGTSLLVLEQKPPRRENFWQPYFQKFLCMGRIKEAPRRFLFHYLNLKYLQLKIIFILSLDSEWVSRCELWSLEF